MLYGLTRLGPAPAPDPRQAVGLGRTTGIEVLAGLIHGVSLVGATGQFDGQVELRRTWDAACWGELNWLERTGVVADLAGLLNGDEFMLKNEEKGDGSVRV